MDTENVCREDLKRMRARHGAFAGVDSDGCVFDTMEVKQRQFFHPAIIEVWSLQPIARTVREVAEFVNLYSAWRGLNRFPALLKTFDLLREHPAARDSGTVLPDTSALRAYIESGLALGHPSLDQWLAAHPDPELVRLRAWSHGLNAAIAARMDPVPPFAGGREALEDLSRHTDIVVVSQTPACALLQEWQAHDLDGCVRLIAGQELGSKTEHLRMATAGKYAADKIIMVGDAPGDRHAAASVGGLFFPINPGHEVESWARLREEALPRFLEGTYRGVYEETLVARFQEFLPTVPPWQST